MANSGSSTSPILSFLAKGRIPPFSIISLVTGSYFEVNSSNETLSPFCSRLSIEWSPISCPRLMLLRSWMGANEAAMTILIPDQRSHCAAGSRLEPVPFRCPETMTSKPPSSKARGSNTRRPPCTNPAYAFSAIIAGSWSKQTQAGVITSVLMSSSKSPTSRSSMRRSTPS